MELKKVNELIEKQSGNYSLFYPILKDRIDKYPCQEVPFPGEFLFFEEKYLQIKKHMIENNINQEIVDIGCQYGFQSEIFLDSNSYLGIDCIKPSHFLNSEKENIHYMVGVFPDIDIDLAGKTVISSMSLGYFNNFVDKDEKKAIEHIVDGLKCAETIYIASKKSFVDSLALHFKSVETLDESEIGDFNLYVLRKEV